MDLQFSARLDVQAQAAVVNTFHQLDHEDLLTTAHIERCVTLTNHRNLALVASKLQGNTAVLHVDVASLANPSFNHVATLANVYRSKAYLMSLSGHFIIGDNTYGNLLLLDGPAEFYFLVDGKCHTKRDSLHDLDDLLRGARESIRDKDSVAGSIKEAEYDYYDVSATELVALMEDNSVSNVSKVISTFYTYFPMCRTTIAMLAHLTPLPTSATNTIANWTPQEPHQDQVEAASGIGLFAPAYSIKENMPHQIDRRLKAVAAASGVAPPANNVVADLFTTSGMGPIDFPARLVPILASAVCIDDQGDVNPDVKTDSLIDLDELARQYGLSAWTVELLTQMRLIYTAYQASSLRFGLSVLPLILSYFDSIGGRFREELDAMEAVNDALSNARYTGMRAKIPDALQVKTVARVIYVGLGYYKKCLHTEEEKKAFEQYATSAIRHHISPSSDADMCDNIIHVLPDRSLVAAIALGQNLPYEEMDIIMQRYTTIEQSIVYKSLIQKDNPGEWASYKKKVADNEASRVLMQEALKKLTDEEASVEREFDLKIRMCRSDEDYYTLATKLEDWKATVSELKKGLLDLEDLLPLAQDPSFQTTRDQVLERMRALFTAIRDTGDKPAGGAVPNQDPPEGS